MQPILTFLTQNGTWIFGGGGAVMAVLAVFRYFSAKNTPAKPRANGTIRADNRAEVVTGDKTVTTKTVNGIDGITLVFVVLALCSLAGFTMTQGGTVASASGNGTAIIGDGNQVNQ